MTPAIVKVLPVPVAPSRVMNSSPSRSALGDRVDRLRLVGGRRIGRVEAGSRASPGEDSGRHTRHRWTAGAAARRSFSAHWRSCSRSPRCSSRAGRRAGDGGRRRRRREGCGVTRPGCAGADQRRSTPAGRAPRGADPRPRVQAGPEAGGRRQRLPEPARQARVRARRTAGLRIGADEAAARITGLLAPDEQLESLYGSTGDLAAAAYDTERDRLYVVSDAVVPNRALVEFVLAHELDHALEDERYGLARHRAARRRRGARRPGARRGVGDLGDGRLRRQLPVADRAARRDRRRRRRHRGRAEVRRRPAALDLPAAATTSSPSSAVCAGGWKLVDYAIEHREPASTEQILHPTKYVHDERPLPTRVDGTALRQAGWRPADRSVLGEYGTGQMLGVGADKAVAAPGGGGLGRRLVRALAALRAPGRVRGTLPLGPRARDGLALGLTAGREAVRTRGADLRRAGPRWRGPRA